MGIVLYWVLGERMRFSSRFLGLSALAVLLAGCAAQADPGGLFQSYRSFAPGPDDGPDLQWVSPELHGTVNYAQVVGAYSGYVVEPILIPTPPGGNFADLTSTEIESLRVDLMASIEAALSNSGLEKRTRARIPQTIVFKLALTSIDVPNRLFATATTVLPLGVGVSTTNWLLTGEHIQVGGATMELLASDGPTGAPLFAVVDRKAGSKSFDQMLDPKSGARHAFAYWAENLRNVIDNAKTRVARH